MLFAVSAVAELFFPSVRTGASVALYSSFALFSRLILTFIKNC